MSYINDALRKAQKDKDNRYERFGEIIAAGSGRPQSQRKRRIVFFAATISLVVLAAAAALFAVRVVWNSEGRQKEILKPSATEFAKPVPAAEKKAEQAAPPVASEADIHYQEALNAQRTGNLRQAETLYENVLKIDPGHVRTLNNLGVIYMGQKRREKAIAVFGRAIVLKKDYVDPYYNLACLYAQTGDIDESLWYLKVAVSIDGSVIEWVKKDADMKNVAASGEFKKMMGGQKN